MHKENEILKALEENEANSLTSGNFLSFEGQTE